MRRFILVFISLTVFFPLVFSQADFTASEQEGCTPFAVKFSIVPGSVDLDTVQQITWRFGNGDIIQSNNPDTIVYRRFGNYSVAMIVTGNNGSDTIRKPGFITVHQTQPANFRYSLINKVDSSQLYTFSPIQTIIDTTENYTYTWRYFKRVVNADESISLVQPPTSDAVKRVTVGHTNFDAASDSFLFSRPGFYYASLAVVDNQGCYDSVMLARPIKIASQLRLQNVFVPESETYYIIAPAENGIPGGIADGNYQYEVILRFEVFTRYGTLVFNQTAPIITWDGRTSSGIELNTGVYYYVLSAVEGDPDGIYSQKGFIHLFR